MGRALRVAQLAAAARCAPASSTLASPRLWKRTAARATTPRFIGLADEMRLGGPAAAARYNHTSSEIPAEEKPVSTSEAASEENAVSEEKPLSAGEPVPAQESVSMEPVSAEEPAPTDEKAEAEAKLAAMMEKMADMEQKMQEMMARMEAQKSAEANKEATPETTAIHLKQWSNWRGRLDWRSGKVRVRFSGSEEDDLVLDPLWLRDACPCETCVDPHSGQKSFATTELPHQPKVELAQFLDNGSLRVVFDKDPLSGGKQHESVFSKSEVSQWKQHESYYRGRPGTHQPVRIPWDKATYEVLLARGRCRISYKDWMDNEPEFWRAFTDLCETGLVFVQDVPEDEESVRRIAERIGQLQHTFYGWTWDVKSKPRAENVAYTSTFLGLHQDLMYHKPVPQLQLLHCLSNSCEGGESLFSNGIRAAYELSLEHPKHYDVLTQSHVWFGYNKNGNHYWAGRRTIETYQKRPVETRWAPPFQVPFRRSNSANVHDGMAKWKTAATTFQKIVESEANMYEVKMKPGECVIFNNSQVLHGRRQFATAEGSRWLKGAYISPQTFMGAVNRLAEYKKAQGVTLPYYLGPHDRELQHVKDSLARRRAAKPAKDAADAADAADTASRKEKSKYKTYRRLLLTPDDE
ncbi:hypothetical protein VTI74DRAFT_6920 [Chaetomium olivicolor]